MAHYIDYDRVYRDSFLRVLSSEIDGRDFFDTFYRHFLDSSPEARQKFANTDFAMQRKMLRESLGFMERFSQYKRADDEILRLATRHSKAELDIAPALYDVWLSSLVSAVAIHDAQFDQDVEIAWRMQLAAGIEYMKLKYDP